MILRAQTGATGSLTLSSRDIESLTRAVELLISPLEHAHVDGWRVAVNRELRELLQADSVGFFLPVADALPMYSEEHDVESLSRYTEIAPPLRSDGSSVFEHVIRLGVSTLHDAYGSDYDRYIKSAYYNEYAAPNEAHDTMTLACALEGAPAPFSMLQFWHARPNGKRFGAREAAILRVLSPAFRAGVETHMRMGQQRANLFATIDALGQAVLVCDISGAVVHQTPALDSMLAADAEGAQLRNEMLATRTGVLEVQTSHACYVIRPTMFANAMGSMSLRLIALERRTPVPRSEHELRGAYGLTRAKIRVATLIARGLPNADIAQLLSISPHTARRHTEKILQKLKVRSRAEVARLLFS
ncbi:MAG: LuxR C-terminal-related transcriptional regulator [Gemmatimonadota bacterium]